MRNEDMQDLVSKSLRRAWQLGQTYWRQADSDFVSQHKKSDITRARFDELIEETRAAVATTPTAVLPEPDAVISELMGLVDEWGGESHLRGEAELDAQHSEATQEEIDCAKDRASKERAAWKAIESKLRALLAQAATAAAPSHPAEGVPAVEQGEVLVTVSGFTGSGKSAIAGEIEILCRALGLQVEWPDGDSEKHMTHADRIAALEQYKPRVRIVECNVPHSVVKGQDK